jgi:uncharacterized protein (TIGR00725 family)
MHSGLDIAPEVTVATIAVVGPSQAAPAQLAAAEQIGRMLAAGGHTLVTGGYGGVMEAASRGAVGTTVVGILSGTDRGEANPYVGVAIPTGLGEMRNALIVRAADAVICVGGSWGTLSEVALAVRTGVPVVVLDGWDLPDGPIPAGTPVEAVDAALAAAQALRPPPSPPAGPATRARRR